LDVIRTPAEHHHRTATEIFDATRARNPEVGFATVHRGLNRLVELGLIARVELPGSDAAFYESDIAAHAHFRCRLCGAIRDLDVALPSDFTARVARDSEVELDEARATFTGVCRTCRGER
jgi:Fe2+ or Zn2+ uptake regulation protein